MTSNTPLTRDDIEDILKNTIGQAIDKALEAKLGPAIDKALKAKLGPAIDNALEAKLGPAIATELVPINNRLDSIEDRLMAVEKESKQRNELVYRNCLSKYGKRNRLFQDHQRLYTGVRVCSELLPAYTVRSADSLI